MEDSEQQPEEEPPELEPEGDVWWNNSDEDDRIVVAPRINLIGVDIDADPETDADPDSDSEPEPDAADHDSDNEMPAPELIIPSPMPLSAPESPRVAETSSLALETPSLAPPDHLEHPTPNVEIYPPPEYFDRPDPYKDPKHAVPDFHLGLMVFATAVDLSVAQYAALREVLQLVQSVTELSSLPETLTTLKARCRRNMPLLNIRGYDCSIDTTKTPPRSANPKKAYRFELEQYGQVMLSDPSLVSHMHFGYAVLDPPERSEIWHGEAWAGSVRTTSGMFPTFGPNNKPLFPSDCVVTKEFERYRVSGIGIIGSGMFKGKVGFIGQRLLEPAEITWPKGLSFDGRVKVCRRRVDSEEYPFPDVSKDRRHLPELVLMEDLEYRRVMPVEMIAQKLWVRLLDYGDVDLTDSLLPHPESHRVAFIAYTQFNSETDDHGCMYRPARL